MKINVNGIELHYLDEGEGAPVLMLHGFPDSSRAWRRKSINASSWTGG